MHNSALVKLAISQKRDSFIGKRGETDLELTAIPGSPKIHVKWAHIPEYLKVQVEGETYYLDPSDTTTKNGSFFVKTGSGDWGLRCKCGSVRMVPTNSLFQVNACTECTVKARKERKITAQREKRRQSYSSREQDSQSPALE